MTQSTGAHVPVASPAPLVGLHCRLRPVVPADYPALYRLELGGDRAALYRHRGVTVSPEQYPATLWAGVLSQFVVESLRAPRFLGLVASYGADLRNGHARLAGILEPDARGLGWPVEGWALFISYLFVTFPLRKLYADVLDANLADVAPLLDRVGTREGRFVEHEFHGGRHMDLHTFAIFREEWTELVAGDSSSVLRRVVRRTRPTPHP